MSKNHAQLPNRRSPAAFPLASLALLVTALACLLVCLDTGHWRQQYASFVVNGRGPLLALFGGASLFGAFVAVVFAARHRLSWRAWLTAPLMGIVAGAAGVLLMLAPGAMWRTGLAVVILLLASTVLRLDAD